MHQLSIAANAPPFCTSPTVNELEISYALRVDVFEDPNDTRCRRGIKVDVRIARAKSKNNVLRIIDRCDAIDLFRSFSLLLQVFPVVLPGLFTTITPVEAVDGRFWSNRVLTSQPSGCCVMDPNFL